LKVTVRAGRYERKAQPELGKQDKEGKWQPHHWRKAVAPKLWKLIAQHFEPTKPLTKEFPAGD
jgi:hypothetical protein